MKRYIVAALALLAVPAIAAEIDSLSAVDASNTARFPENQSPGSLNDGARALEGIVARWSQDESCVIASAGSSSVWTLSATRTLTSYYDGLKICFDAHTDNSAGPITLNVDSLGAVTIKKENDENLAAGDIETGMKVEVVYDGTNFQLLSPTVNSSSPDDLITTRGDLLYGDGSAAAARLAIGSADQFLGSDGTDVAWNDIALPRSYLAGMGLTVGTDTDHDIDIAAGEARDATDAANIELAAITKQADATFAEGSAAGGMVSGESLPTSGTIHVWAIVKADGTSDVMFNNHATSGLSPSLPSGFVYKRRIASLRTDGSANILGFIQKGDRFDYTAVPAALDWNDATPPTTAELIVLNVPLGLKLDAIVNTAGNNTGGATTDVLLSNPASFDAAPSISAVPLAMGAFKTTSEDFAFQVIVGTDTSGQIRIRSTGGSSWTWSGVAIGWFDTRGRDD